MLWIKNIWKFFELLTTVFIVVVGTRSIVMKKIHNWMGAQQTWDRTLMIEVGICLPRFVVVIYNWICVECTIISALVRLVEILFEVLNWIYCPWFHLNFSQIGILMIIMNALKLISYTPMMMMRRRKRKIGGVTIAIVRMGWVLLAAHRHR